MPYKQKCHKSIPQTYCIFHHLETRGDMKASTTQDIYNFFQEVRQEQLTQLELQTYFENYCGADIIRLRDSVR